MNCGRHKCRHECRHGCKHSCILERRHRIMYMEQLQHWSRHQLFCMFASFLQYGCNGSVRKELPFTDRWIDFTQINPDGKSVSHRGLNLPGSTTLSGPYCREPGPSQCPFRCIDCALRCLGGMCMGVPGKRVQGSNSCTACTCQAVHKC
jgi:hypothetical protein